MIDDGILEATDAIDTSSVILPAVVDVEALERCLDRWLRHGNVWTTPLLVDLSRVAAIDVPALVYIISLAQQRFESRLVLRLRLPVDREVRNFLRIWQFQAALEASIGRPLYALVQPEDRSYFGEDQVSAARSRSAVSPWGDLVKTLEEDRFFSFRAYTNLSLHYDALMIQDACKHWSAPFIMRVLARYLRTPEAAGDVSRVLIYEALANARQHPDAETVLVASQFNLRDRSTTSGLPRLSLCVWDDGVGVLTTLKSCLERGLSIRPGGQSQLPSEDFAASYQDIDSYAITEERVPTTLTPDSTSPDWVVLLSSFFPGISRKNDWVGPAVPDYGQWESIRPKPSVEPGMGLFALLRTVVEAFRGSVELRTDKYFVLVDRGVKPDDEQEAARYRARIRRSPSYFPPFRGNMLTIRLPLNRPMG